MSLETIHSALLEFVKTRWELFSGCTRVLLENQPVFKNPHMKSVQVLLFATLHSSFLEKKEYPTYHFIHAKKKVNGPKGDIGYKDRKDQSEQRCINLFETGKVYSEDNYKKWKFSNKKSDMADALCMCVDYIS